MRSEKLQDAIGGIRDQYILDAHEKTSRKKRETAWKRAAAIAACICLCICAAVPALAAADNEFAYETLYALSPTFAQKLKPVHRFCENDGIKMEVISANIHGERAEILVSMQDMAASRLDETTDLFDSYSINTPFSSTGTCSMVGFDKQTKTATFLVELTQWDNAPIPGDKITFSVKRILSQKQHTSRELSRLDLTKAPEKPELLKKADIRGWGTVGSDAVDVHTVKLLAPQEKNSFAVLPGVSITGYGVVDGKLHIQARYENILETDNHGEISLEDTTGQTISCTSSVSFWDHARQSSYEEYVFDLPSEKLNQYRACGTFWTCGRSITGDWQITFPLN